MLQNARFGTGLNKYVKYINIFDNSKTSDQYFRLFDVPDKLYTGTNSFRIRANLDSLVRGSLIYIDIIDSTGKVIYHEIADFVGEDQSRLIIAHIYENTPPGEATIFIAGRTSRNATTGERIPYTTKPGEFNHIDFPNVMWSGKVIIIPNQQNNDEILFGKPPTVSSVERFEFYNKYTGAVDRKIIESGSHQFALRSVVGAYEYSNTSRYATRGREGGVNTILDPVTANGKISSNQTLIPLYSDLATLVATSGSLNRDMVGGEIVFRDMNTVMNISTDIYNIPDFSCSIIEVVDSQTAKVSPGFNVIYDHYGNKRQLNSFISADNYTASYYSSTPALESRASESFVQLDFVDLEPLAGSVESVKISYKPYGSFGEFINIGDFPITSQNFLVDTTDLVTTKIDLVERPIGDFASTADFDTYWEIIDGSNEIQHQSSSVLESGRAIESTVLDPTADYIGYIKLQDSYAVEATENTEFKLSFSLQYEEAVENTKPLQIDIHVSGSGIQRDIVREWPGETPIKSLLLGDYIGTVVETGIGQTRKYNFYFKTKNAGGLVPYFVLRNTAKFSIKSITLSPRNELGFSPNQAKLFLPIDTLKTDTELVMNIDYMSGTGIKSKVSSQLYGLTFTGQGINWDDVRNTPDGIISSSEQLEFPSGSVPEGTISGSGQLPPGIISGSEQLPDGTISGSGQLPPGIISGSEQLPDGTVSGSDQVIKNLPDGTISGSDQVIKNLPGGTISGSTQIVFPSGSVPEGTISGSGQLPPGIISGSEQLPGDLISGSGQLPPGIISGSDQLPEGTISGSDQVIKNLPGGTISGSEQLPDNLISGSGQIRDNLPEGTISGSEQLPDDLISGSEQLPPGIISGSEQLPDGTISGSGQLPEGTISGSGQLPDGIVSGSDQVRDNLPTGIVSGSEQLPDNLISGSDQLPGGIISGSEQLPDNLISGSDQVRDNLPTGTVSGSDQVINNLPDGTISGSEQLPDGTISGSDQIRDNLPDGTISGSDQLPDNLISGSEQLPDNLISGSDQIRDNLPTGIVSGSDQLPGGIISGSDQIRDNLPDGTISGSNQIQDNLPDGTISGSDQLPNNLISGSDQIQDNLPDGTISGSSQLPNNLISGSDQIRDNLPDGTISGSSQLPDGTISGSGQLPEGIISGSEQLPENLISGSEQLPNNLISGSGQLPTGIVSGSDQIRDNLPDGTISGSNQIIDNLPGGTISGSNQIRDNLPEGTISGSDQLPNNLISGSEQLPGGIISGSEQLPEGTISGSDQLPGGIISGSEQLPDGTISGSDQIRDNLPDGTISGSNQVITNLPDGTISGSNQLPIGIVSGSEQVINNLPDGTISGSNQLPTGIVSGSEQLPDGIFSGSEQLPDGVISGSNQIADDISGSWSTERLPANTISGSSQVDYLNVDNIPTGIVSGSDQLPDGIVSGSEQVKNNLPDNTISGSAQLPDGIVSGSDQLPIGIVSGSDQIRDNLPDNTISGSAQIDYLSVDNIPIGIISGSSQIDDDISGSFTEVSGSIATDIHDNVTDIATNTTAINTLNDAGLISGSEQLPDGIISGSEQLPNGIISGSEQLPDGTISGSDQVDFTGSSGWPVALNIGYAGKGPASEIVGTLAGQLYEAQEMWSNHGTVSRNGEFTVGSSVPAGSTFRVAGNIWAEFVTYGTIECIVSGSSGEIDHVLYIYEGGATAVTQSVPFSYYVTASADDQIFITITKKGPGSAKGIQDTNSAGYTSGIEFIYIG
tara:strand:+ start:45341 stop:50557 length:5217 start_codon:yes stop_codon:yes gene_type:complete